MLWQKSVNKFMKSFKGSLKVKEILKECNKTSDVHIESTVEVVKQRFKNSTFRRVLYAKRNIDVKFYKITDSI